MLAKLTFNLVFIWMMTSYLVCATHLPPYCSQCEEEMWEEVPCDEIASFFTTTPAIITTTATPISPTLIPITTTPAPATTTARYQYPISKQTETTHKPTTAYAPPYIPQTTPAPQTTAITSTEAPDEFKKCYCQCKMGCKEFCRKVVVDSDTKKQITQITKTLQKTPEGRIQVEHLHQRKFLPNPYAGSQKHVSRPRNPIQPARIPYVVGNTLDLGNIYSDRKPTYPSAAAAAQHSNSVLESTGYTIEELAKLVKTDNVAKTIYLNPPAPIYYAQPPSPNYGHNSAITNSKYNMRPPYAVHKTVPVVHNPKVSMTYPAQKEQRKTPVSVAAAKAITTTDGIINSYVAKYASYPPGPTTYNTIASPGTPSARYINKYPRPSSPLGYGQGATHSATEGKSEFDLAIDKYLKDYISAGARPTVLSLSY